jgi:hypothetical protein
VRTSPLTAPTSSSEAAAGGPANLVLTGFVCVSYTTSPAEEVKGSGGGVARFWTVCEPNSGVATFCVRVASNNTSFIKSTIALINVYV